MHGQRLVSWPAPLATSSLRQGIEVSKHTFVPHRPMRFVADTFKIKIQTLVIPSCPLARGTHEQNPAKLPQHIGALEIYKSNLELGVLEGVLNKKSHGMALEFVYRAEDGCKSSGDPAGAFPRSQ